MRKWSTQSLAALKGIHPDLRRVMDRALQEAPMDIRVLEGLRSKSRQEYLVKTGKSKTMNSRHLTGHAVDIMPIAPSGADPWDWKYFHLLAPAVKLAATREGVVLEWGGDWKSFPDGPHWQLPWNLYPA